MPLRLASGINAKRGIMGMFSDIFESIVNLFKGLTTKYNHSSRWKEWLLGKTQNHCWYCIKQEHKIFEVIDGAIIPEGEQEPPVHINCGCYLESLRMVAVGAATMSGNEGADYWIYYYRKLPDRYISKEEAKALGWKPILGNLDEVAPGKMIGGSVYGNRDGKLPSAPGRIWYECDIDYQGGYRNNMRLIYSNDGLIFKTDDHYTSFIAVE